jgi:hypothetical protein
MRGVHQAAKFVKVIGCQCTGGKFYPVVFFNYVFGAFKHSWIGNQVLVFAERLGYQYRISN